MSDFIKKWHSIIKEKNSNICAWLDPSLYEMWRWEKWLPKWVGKLEWSLKYIEAVAPYVSAIKPNAGSWWWAWERALLKEIVNKIHEMWLLAIVDAKIADLWFTNDSWIYDYKNLWFDAVTVAPYAGNIESVVKFWKDRDIAIISMWLMSNPEYKTEMNFVSTVWYATNSGQIPAGTTLWESRVIRSIDAWVDWLVVWGTYTKNDKEFMKFIEMTNNLNIVYLIPWIWAQWWQIKDFLASGINPKKCIINSGRDIMFPNWSNSTNSEQALAAKKLRDAFNN
jgi:hypothetical protein